jgi:hypothetical protein
MFRPALPTGTAGYAAHTYCSAADSVLIKRSRNVTRTLAAAAVTSAPHLGTEQKEGTNTAV